MKLTIIRPTDISDDKLDELKAYLLDRWHRAERGRQEQVEDKHIAWLKAYNGDPLEKERSVPFYKSSNFVVKLIRMFIDTFVARTLNIVYATEPILVVKGLPQELKESWEAYINTKALDQWDFYKLTRSICFRGVRNGTVVTKTTWEEESEIVMSESDGKPVETSITTKSRPTTTCIPFEDFYIYPITINELDEAEIIFHKVRYSEEQAKRMVDSGKWTLPEDKEIEDLLVTATDAKCEEQSDQTGVTQTHYQEVVGVECHLKWSFESDSTKTRSIIVVIHPKQELQLDLYYNPYPRNRCTFSDYRPYPKEDFWWGDSMSQILGQSQEECSSIHNERRNNSTIANAPVFKRRNGAGVPNPSTNWYPGKVFDLEDMTDLDVLNIGRNYDGMIDQEQFTMQFANNLVGISENMTGSSTGSSGQNGVYNTMGTMAVMAEGNQRQDTNIRDVRQTLSRIGCLSSELQAVFGTDDPYIATLSKSDQTNVQAVFKLLSATSGHFLRFKVKASDAGANKEVERANLMQIAQVLSQYGVTVQQMVMQLANPKLNSAIRKVMNDVVGMQRWMAQRLLRQFDEFDASEILPDIGAAIESVIPGGSQGSSPNNQQSMDPGGAGNILPPLSKPGLQALSEMATLPGGPPNGSGMAQGGLA